MLLGDMIVEEKTMVSCGGVVIHKGKALVLYRKNRQGAGWVLPKGKTEFQESRKQTALREVKEEAGAKARVVKPIGKTQYSFQRGGAKIIKTVYWFLMTANSFYCKPQAEECFADGGFYKQHEAYHLLKYQDEKEILCRAFIEYSGKEILRKGTD
jgi:8-oxo-dGTP pyrophosphatase MutT (NUDIX family)